MCGEKRAGQAGTAPAAGSPPHVRGKAEPPQAATSRHRITPACAGKSAPAGQKQPGAEDHPRMCGEKVSVELSADAYEGSPPHVRGKEREGKISRTIYGITPACAGKRLKRSRSTVPPVAIVPLFPSVCNKSVVSNGSPAGRDAPLFLPAENAAPAPAGSAGSCPASRSSQLPPRILVISPRP